MWVMYFLESRKTICDKLSKVTDRLHRSRSSLTDIPATPVDSDLLRCQTIRKPNPLSLNSTARISRDVLSRSTKLALETTDKLDLGIVIAIKTIDFYQIRK